jgi:hypothetical protein
MAPGAFLKIRFDIEFKATPTPPIARKLHRNSVQCSLMAVMTASRGIRPGDHDQQNSCIYAPTMAL